MESTVEPTTVPRIVKQAAIDHAGRVAIQEDERQISFAELDALRVSACRAFMASGIEPGDRVAIWAPNISEWIVAAIGVHSAGGVVVPLNTRLKGAEAAHILNASGAKMLMTVKGFLGIDYPAMLEGQDTPELNEIVVLRGEPGNLADWSSFLVRGSEIDEASAAARAAAVSPDDVMDIMFTSGTTGKPKGVITAHGQNIRAFDVWSNTVGLRDDDNYLIINPFFHSFGYKAGWLAAIIRGAKILPVLTFDLDQVLAQIVRDKVSMLPGPPTIYQSILSHPARNDFDLSSLRLAVTGAAAVPVELVEKMRTELGFETVVTAYGLTETCGVVTICRAEDDAETISHTSGCAMPGVEVRCVDVDGNDVTEGEAGEILVRGFNVMRGYFNNDEATAEAIDSDGWLHTGDVGVLDQRGYIRITDRLKDMIISGGFNIYPAEIENALAGLDGVSQSAAVGVDDERMGEVVRVFIVAMPGAALTEEGVIQWCRENMANYKVPRSVVFLDEMPLNASGKILKTELRTR